VARPSEHLTEPLRPTKNATGKYAEKQTSSFEKEKVKPIESKEGSEGEEDEIEEKIDLEGEVDEREESENRRLSQDGLRLDPQKARKEQRRNGQRGQGQAGEEEEEEEVVRTVKKNTKGLLKTK